VATFFLEIPLDSRKYFSIIITTTIINNVAARLRQAMVARLE